MAATGRATAEEKASLGTHRPFMDSQKRESDAPAGGPENQAMGGFHSESMRPLMSAVTDHLGGTTSIMRAPNPTGDTSSLLQAAQRLEAASPPYPPMLPRPPTVAVASAGKGAGSGEQSDQGATDAKAEAPVMVDDSVIMKGGEAAKAADFANYFVSYAYLYHQKQMLTDHRRMSAYYNAIMGNAEVFKGKTVLDVGTGTGVLAVWAAKAGAARVIAVEFTDMAKHAQNVVNKNGVGHIVTVVQGSAEDLSCLEPHSVDIIVSEWMGYFLLRESMLDSLLRVREKYLKPEGALYPSHCSMFWALVDDEEERHAKANEFSQALQEWNAFTYETSQYYGLDLTGLSRQYEDEQRQYYMLSSAWAELKTEQIIGNPVELYRLDLKTCSFADVKGVPPTPFTFHLLDSQRISAFAGWFTTDFLGCDEHPVPNPTTLSTGPEAGYTHWGQQVFYLLEPLDLNAGDRLEGTVAMTRQADNARLYDVEVSFYVIKDGQPANFISHKYQIP